MFAMRKFEGVGEDLVPSPTRSTRRNQQGSSWDLYPVRNRARTLSTAPSAHRSIFPVGVSARVQTMTTH